MDSVRRKAWEDWHMWYFDGPGQTQLCGLFGKLSTASALLNGERGYLRVYQAGTRLAMQCSCGVLKQDLQLKRTCTNGSHLDFLVGKQAIVVCTRGRVCIRLRFTVSKGEERRRLSEAWCSLLNVG